MFQCVGHSSSPLSVLLLRVLEPEVDLSCAGASSLHSSLRFMKCPGGQPWGASRGGEQSCAAGALTHRGVMDLTCLGPSPNHSSSGAGHSPVLTVLSQSFSSATFPYPQVDSVDVTLVYLLLGGFLLFFWVFSL